MRLAVRHVTTYRFDPTRRGVVQSLRLWPSECENQTVIDWTVEIEGATRGAEFREGSGDRIETASILGAVEEVTVEVTGTVETTDKAGVLTGFRERVSPLTYLRPTAATETDSALKSLAEEAVTGIESPLDRAHALSKAIRDAITYAPGQTNEATTAAEALALGHGVCQDHAHAMIACARVLGLPGRYVVGYLHAEGGAAEASHAWAEVWIEGLGWVGFDASNGVSPDENYIRIGSGFNATDAAPIRGMTMGGGVEEMDVAVEVSEAAQ